MTFPIQQTEGSRGRGMAFEFWPAEERTTASYLTPVLLRKLFGDSFHLAQRPANVHTVLLAPRNTMTVPEMRKRVREADATECCDVARAFGQRASEVPIVEQVWFDPHGFEVIATVSERDLDTELHLYAIFRELTQQLSNPATGDLTVLLAPFMPEGATLLYSR